MENQHTKIRGYRDLTRAEIDLMNESKEHGEALGELIKRLEAVETIDKRWLAIAKTTLQQGIMFLVRSVAKPSTF